MLADPQWRCQTDRPNECGPGVQLLVGKTERYRGSIDRAIPQQAVGTTAGCGARVAMESGQIPARLERAGLFPIGEGDSVYNKMGFKDTLLGGRWPQKRETRK